MLFLSQFAHRQFSFSKCIFKLMYPSFIGDFVESDHTLQCTQYSCSVASVVTAPSLAPSQMFGVWQLLATTHVRAGGGTATMEIMIGNGGTARVAIATNLM